jgi:hypothetical protein
MKTDTTIEMLVVPPPPEEVVLDIIGFLGINDV